LWPGACKVIVQGDIVIDRLTPLGSGRDTEIDMIEREMEGGVVVIQPPEVHEHHVEDRVGGLIRVEEQVDIREFPKPSVVPKA
jgi:hypothetical protein